MCRGISTQDISLEEWLVVDWHPNHSNGSGGKDCSHPRKHSDTVKVATHRVATANWATTLDALLSIGNTLLCNGLPIHAVPGTGHALWCKAKFAQIEPGCWVPDWLAFFSQSSGLPFSSSL